MTNFITQPPASLCVPI